MGRAPNCVVEDCDPSRSAEAEAATLVGRSVALSPVAAILAGMVESNLAVEETVDTAAVGIVGKEAVDILETLVGVGQTRVAILAAARKAAGIAAAACNQVAVGISL